MNRLAVIVGVMVALSFLVCAVMLVLQGEITLTKRPDSWAETVNGLLILLGLGALTGHWLALHQRRLVREHELDARTDALTGLLNRRGLAEYFDKAGLQPDCAVIRFDLDRFKTVNDVHRHSAGVAMVREQDSHADDVIRRADMALYQAKDSGRNRVMLQPTALAISANAAHTA